MEDPERYLSLWHRGASPAEIKRDNLKEFFAWAFLNKSFCDPDDQEELEEYINTTEIMLGRKLEPGRGRAIPLRVTLDKVKTLYRPLLWYLINEPKEHDADESLGIIAIEIMPVSFRITGAALKKDDLCDEVLQILQQHGWEKFILVSHSYGSVISSHLIHSPKTSAMVGPVVLIDPVSILLHLPDVAYNFTCRPPKRANERQLSFFASTDQSVAHTLGRCFFWSENILWKGDMQGRQWTVALAGKDLLVNTEAVGRYLAKDLGRERPSEDHWKHETWKGQGLDIFWFDELDHAQVFDSKRGLENLVGVVREYSLMG
ncbi:hypothetical protein ACLMJK_005042 [Lecanora helva]